MYFFDLCIANQPFVAQTTDGKQKPVPQVAGLVFYIQT
jgi:hypothetical protein